MNLIFIGFRCSGKTSVGRLVAKRLELEFVDVDDLVERRRGMSIAEVWRENGESTFRALESSLIADLARRDKQVIALGGGTVVRYRNVQSLRHNGTFVLLEADCETISERMKSDPLTGSRRPSLRGKSPHVEIEEESGSRRSYYLNLADYVVSTSRKSLGIVVEEVLNLLITKGAAR